MNVKKIALLGVLAAGVTTSALAADVRITINGQLDATTCKVDNATGELAKTVTLPTLTSNTLSAAGATGGRRPIDLAVSGCDAATTKALVHFEGGGANITPAGGLANTATAGAATNVEIQLLDAQAAPLNVNTANPEYTLTSGAGNIRMYAQYHSPNGNAGPGIVTSTVALSFEYK